MSLPAVPQVVIRLGTGPTFGNVLILGSLTDGILGTNALGTEIVETIDISSQVQQISTRRGRDRIFEEYSPGTATVRFLDFNGDWNPQNTLSPYYEKILPMRQIIISTTFEGEGYPIFSGFITSWEWQWADAASDHAIVTLQCVDATRLLQLSQITTVPFSQAGDLPGERISYILGAVGWPASNQVLTEGDTALQADPGTARSALEAIQTVEQSDLGWFYVNQSGITIYLSRANLAVRQTFLPYLFQDEPSFLFTRYRNVAIGLDDTDLANEVTITRAGGSPQTASDATSIDEYGLRSFSRSDLLMDDDVVANNKANAIMNYRKTPRLRVDRITLDLSSTFGNQVATGLALDFGYPIQVQKTMPGGTSIDVTVTVTGLNHTITPDRWILDVQTAEPLSVAFLLGSSIFGILGTSTL